MEIPDRRFLISSIAGESLPCLNHFLYGLALTPFRTVTLRKLPLHNSLEQISLKKVQGKANLTISDCTENQVHTEPLLYSEFLLYGGRPEPVPILNLRLKLCQSELC